MSTPNLTPAELKVLALAWHCFTEMPKVDYAKLAELGPYKTNASASAVYLSARKKLLGGLTNNVTNAGSEGSDGTPATPKTPKSAGKQRAATEEGGTPATGAKKKRRTKAEMAAAAAAAADGDEDDEEQGLSAGKEDGDDVTKVLEGAADAIDEAGAEAVVEGETKIKGEEDDE
ncbi:unnamed protein product [Zymoseptoria tritici ST99CH_1A5]|uniref:Uncharacterized protein n=1 Tax=Zymoseptoria tritici ST99CH_1A5 TaxID=1276529 RepID=A0A1Y6LXA4_ZYMTR|nr:unnamed protein product [Zymoseptoria tritici ST99CH_1A5]